MFKTLSSEYEPLVQYIYSVLKYLYIKKLITLIQLQIIIRKYKYINVLLKLKLRKSSAQWLSF